MDGAAAARQAAELKRTVANLEAVSGNCVFSILHRAMKAEKRNMVAKENNFLFDYFEEEEYSSFSYQGYN